MQPLMSRLGLPALPADLLEQALTHRSHGQPHNERLEFLGDAVLGLCVAQLLFERFPHLDEGKLSRMRANLVNEARLAELARAGGLSEHLRLGDGERRSGGAGRASILADAYEALIGVVYLAHGLSPAQRFVRHQFGPLIEAGEQRTVAEKDPKTSLQEWLQQRRLALPRYQVVGVEGEAHRQQFCIEVGIDAPRALRARGVGSSKRAAEFAAASSLLEQLRALPSASDGAGP
jgi:ribonuclease-3